MKINGKRRILFFVSLIGIIVVSMIMMTTYAYQTIYVEYEDGSDSDVTVNVATLDVSFTTSEFLNISKLPLLKDYKTAEYTELIIDNTKSTDDVVYQIELTDVTKTSNILNKYVKYTIVEVNENNETIIGEGNLIDLSDNNWIFKFKTNKYDTISKGTTKKLRIYIWILEKASNQNGLENASLKGKISITSYFAGDVVNTPNEVDTSFAATILRNGALVKLNDNSTKTLMLNTTSPNIGANATNNDDSNMGLFQSDDDDGPTYYFRGPVVNNYVNFAGKCWRIVRIDGKGNIRLILASTKGTCEIDSNLDSLSAFIRDKDDYLIAHYQYSGVLDKFLNGGDIIVYPYYDPDNAEFGSHVWENKTYSFLPLISSVEIENSIADVYQCTGGRAVEEEAPSEYYPYYYRTEAAIRISGGTYTMECDGIPQNSSKIYLLTPDELLFAGTGILSYIYENANASYWLNYEYSGGDDVSYAYTYVATSGNGLTSDYSEYGYGWNVEFHRPMISLVNNMEWVEGDGTRYDPYEVRLAS